MLFLLQQCLPITHTCSGKRSKWDTLAEIPPFPSNLICLQVFHVPLEERRYKDNSQFGEGEEAKVCLDIMQRTGAHIELSLAKDQGLSIMVTGKLDSVMKARKEIVARLQTQVCSPRLLVPIVCLVLKLRRWGIADTQQGLLTKAKKKVKQTKWSAAHLILISDLEDKMENRT